VTTFILDDIPADASRHKARKALYEALNRPLDGAEAEEYDADLFSFSEEAQAAQAANDAAFGDATYGLEPL
jgi:hypothetical protein